MNWKPDDVVEVTLTILVVDLRSSSTFFAQSGLHGTLQFLQAFTTATGKAVTRAVGQPSDDVHVVKFTGDGYLILFAEPVEGSGPPLGSARALAAAKLLREEVRTLCDQWQVDPDPDTGADATKVGLVCGIAFGTILYGQVVDPFLPQYDALGEPVVQAFRYAQARPRPSIGNADRIWISLGAHEQIESFRQQVDPTGQPTLLARIDGVTFDLADFGSLPGVDDTKGYLADWAVQQIGDP